MAWKKRYIVGEVLLLRHYFSFHENPYAWNKRLDLVNCLDQIETMQLQLTYISKDCNTKNSCSIRLHVSEPFSQIIICKYIL